MRRIDSSVTVEEQVFCEIRDAILTGELAPGSRLVLRDLADKLDVSSLPVRAALSRLRAEGLVRHAPRSGSVVAPLERDELEEIQAFRFGIESLAARLGAERIGPKDVERMRRRLGTLERLAGERDLKRFLDAEGEFREVCYRASGRERLVGYVRDHRLKAERYLLVAFSTPRAFGESLVFQRELLAACERHDGAGAEQTTRDAVEWSRDTLREQLAGGQSGAAAG